MHSQPVVTRNGHETENAREPARGVFSVCGVVLALSDCVTGACQFEFAADIRGFPDEAGLASDATLVLRPQRLD
jgi:hypothetical protein